MEGYQAWIIGIVEKGNRSPLGPSLSSLSFPLLSLLPSLPLSFPLLPSPSLIDFLNLFVEVILSPILSPPCLPQDGAHHRQAARDRGARQGEGGRALVDRPPQRLHLSNPELSGAASHQLNPTLFRCHFLIKIISMFGPEIFA